MKDMKYYFSKEPVPDMGFSPDGAYPVTNREKLHLALVKTENDKDNNGRKDKHNMNVKMSIRWA